MKIGFIGTGNMAQAIIKGLLKVGNISPENILVHSGHDTYKKLAAQYGLTAEIDNYTVAKNADIIFIGVKPYLVANVLTEVKSAMNPQKLVVSMAAGVNLKTLQDNLTPTDAIARIMPNINVAELAGITAIVYNEMVSTASKTALNELMSQIGGIIELPEKDFTTFSALGGSSPAFVYLFIDAMSRAGVKHGLSKQQATQIAAYAVLGSAKNLLASTQTPWSLIDQVCSPGGTTVAGLLEMENQGFMSAVVAGIDATIQKDLQG